MESLRNNMFKRMNTTIDDVFPLMERDEQMKLTMLSLSGQIDYRNQIVCMGSDAMNRLNQFEQKMIDKYYTEVNK